MTLGRSTGLTDPGRKRRQNEDAFVCEPPLFAVADGMGGAQAGEIASRLAAAALREETDRRMSGEDRVAALIQEANRRIYQRSSEDAAVSGMGTTITVALVDDGTVAIGHVGDSRAYLIRQRKLEQLTEDHSLVAELVRSGKLSPEEAETHPQRSVITRVLGTDPEVDVDTFSVEAKPGDVFLLCSDGLTSMVDDETILEAVERNRGDLETAARSLIEAANRRGGEDNITVVFFEIGKPLEETARMPAVETDGASPDDEDTLTGLEIPPEMRGEPWAESPEPEPEPEAEPERRRFRHPVALTLGALVLVAAIFALALWGLSSSHFVGARKDGHVAVYQGIPFDIVGSVRLYREVYVSPMLAAQLTQPERHRLFGHNLESYDKALMSVKRFEQEAAP